MDKFDTDFDAWFDCLQMSLADEGIDFQDKDSVADDYDSGANMFDVLDSIKAEYRS